MSFIFPSNSKMYLDFTNGIIGIGTTNPTSNLHVVGNLTVTGDTNLSSISFTNGITGILNTAAQPNVTSIGTLTNLTVSGNITTSTGIITQGPISASGQSITAFSFQGKELSLEPQIMDSTALYISNGGASIDGDIIQTSGTTTLKTTTIDENVGIGTAVPQANLHVHGRSYLRGNVGIGNIANTSNLTIFCNSLNITNESGTNALLINSGNSSTDYTRTCLYLGADSTGNVAYIQSSRVGANLPLLLNNRGGNVGINTNAPRATLDVFGTANIVGTLTVGGSTTLPTSVLVGSNYALGCASSGLKILVGTVSWSMPSQNSNYFTFSNQFSFTSTPRVFLQMASGSYANYVTTQTDSIGTNGFSMWAQQSVATGTQTYSAYWLAFGS